MKINIGQTISVSIIILAFVDYLLYLKFLVININIYIEIFVLSLILTILIYIVNKKLDYLNYFKYLICIFMFIYMVFFGNLYLNVENYKYIETVLPIKGYYTRGIDGVLFNFQEKKFDRPINKINDDILKNDPIKNYNLKIGLMVCRKNIFFIDKIIIVKK